MLVSTDGRFSTLSSRSDFSRADIQHWISAAAAQRCAIAANSPERYYARPNLTVVCHAEGFCRRRIPPWQDG